MGIRTPLQPYISTALGASEVRLLELADAYRAIASGRPGGPVRRRSRDRRLRRRRCTRRRGAARAIRSAGLRRDPGRAARCRAPSGRHRPRPRPPRLSGPGDGQDRDDERLPRCPVRGVHLRDARGSRWRSGSASTTTAPWAEGDRRARGAADLPRDHAPRLRRTSSSGRRRASPRHRSGIDQYLATQAALSSRADRRGRTAPFKPAHPQDQP